MALKTVAQKKGGFVKTASKPRVFVLKNKPYPRLKTHPCACEIVDNRDEKDGTTLIQYVKGQSDIYADTHYKKNGSNEPLHPESMSFENGVMIVPPSARGLLNFIENSTFLVGGRNYQESSTFQFFEYNAEKSAKESNEKEDAYVDAISIIKNNQTTKEGMELLLSYAEVIGIDIENAQLAIQMLRGVAKNDPQAFLDGFGSKLMKAKWWVTKAIKGGYITVNENVSSVISQAGLPIFTAPKGTLNSEIVDEFCVFCETNEGSAIYSGIKQFVEGKL